MQKMLKNAPGLHMTSYYFPIFHKFKGMVNVDFLLDHKVPTSWLTQLPPRLQQLSFTYGLKDLAFVNSLPSTLTKITVSVKDAVVDLAAFPANVTSLSIRINGMFNDIKCSTMMEDRPELLSFSLKLHHMFSIQHSKAVEYFVQRTPFLTAVFLSFLSCESSSEVWPQFPYPKRIRKMDVIGNTRTLIDVERWMAHFPNASYTFKIGICNMDHDNVNTFYSSNARVLSNSTYIIKAYGSASDIQSFNKLHRLKRLELTSSMLPGTFTAIDELPPSLTELHLRNFANVVIPKSVTSLMLYGKEHGDVYGYTEVKFHDEGRYRILDGISTDVFVDELSYAQMELLTSLHITDMGKSPYIPRLAGKLLTLPKSYLRELSIIGNESNRYIDCIYDIIDACSHFTGLRQLCLKFHHRNNDLHVPTESTVITLPPSIIHLTLNMHIKITVAAFPPMLKTLFLGDVELSDENLLTLRNAPLIVFSIGGVSNPKQMLKIMSGLPFSISSINIRSDSSSLAMIAIDDNTYEEIKTYVIKRKRYLKKMWVIGRSWIVEPH